MDPGQVVLLSRIMIGASLIAMGLCFAALSYPLYKGMVKMNHFYGVRTPRAFASEENWYRMNRYGGKLLMIWSVCLALFGLIVLLSPFASVGQAMMALLLGVASVFVPVAFILWQDRQMPKRG